MGDEAFSSSRNDAIARRSSLSHYSLPPSSFNLHFPYSPLSPFDSPYHQFNPGLLANSYPLCPSNEIYSYQQHHHYFNYFANHLMPTTPPSNRYNAFWSLSSQQGIVTFIYLLCYLMLCTLALFIQPIIRTLVCWLKR